MARFYDRKKELESLEQIEANSFTTAKINLMLFASSFC